MVASKSQIGAKDKAAVL